MPRFNEFLSGPIVPRARRICLIGARGVGKSSLIRAALPRLGNWVHVIGSDILTKLLPEGTKMSDLSTAEQVNLRQQAALEMMKIDLTGRTGLLCEGHCALSCESSKRFEEIFTPADDALFTEIIEFILPPDEILRRRMRDLSKHRPHDLEAIRAEMEAEHIAALHVCLRTGATLTTLGADDLPSLLRILQS
jgi:adenylate kinase